MFCYCPIGKTEEVNLSDEGVDSADCHDLDGDGEFLPPPSKKIHVTTASQSSETEEQVMACELEIAILYILPRALLVMYPKSVIYVTLQMVLLRK